MSGESQKFDGMTLAAALRIAIADDPEVKDLVRSGLDIPEGEIVWMDALKSNAVPELYWDVSEPNEDFGQSDLSLKMQEDAALALLLVGDLNNPASTRPKVLTSRVGMKPGAEDQYHVYRDRFRQIIKKKFHTVLDLLRAGKLVAKGLRLTTGSEERIDTAMWSSGRSFINPATSELYDDRHVDASPRYEQVTVWATEASVNSTSSALGRPGRQMEYDWERCEALLADVLLEMLGSKVGADVLNRLEKKIQSEPGGGLFKRNNGPHGMPALPSKKAIDAAMSKRFGILWDRLRGRTSN